MGPVDAGHLFQVGALFFGRSTGVLTPGFLPFYRSKSCYPAKSSPSVAVFAT